MFKKLISLVLVTVLLMLGTGFADVENNITFMDDYELRLADEKVIFTETLDDNFFGDSVVVILTKAASRDNRDWTVDDFHGIGAIEIEDIDRLSDEENTYAERLWTAERGVFLSERGLYTEQSRNKIQSEYFEARAEAETNTLVNFDEYRRIMLIRLDKDCKENVLQVISKLQQREDIRFAGPNTYEENMIESIREPNDYYYRLFASQPNNRRAQWAPAKIGLPKAWAIETGVQTVNVGILDSGINRGHPDLINRVNVSLSRDFTTGNPNGIPGGFTDPYGHGTHVAGIIGAQANNALCANTPTLCTNNNHYPCGGIAGVAWNVQLVSLRVLDSTGKGEHVHTASAIAYARKQGIPILNGSIGMGHNNTSNISIRDAVASYNGLLVVVAASGFAGAGYNINSNPIFGGFPNVLVVGSSTSNDTISQFSNYGSTSVHLFAPGEDIISTCARPNGGNCPPTVPQNRRCNSTAQSPYCTASGTSMAAPMVTGVAALILSAYPNATTLEIRWAIIEGIERVLRLRLDCISGGRLNAYSALRAMETYGIHHIRNVSNGRYLSINGTSLTTEIDKILDSNTQRWVVQRLPNVNASRYEIRSFNPFNGGIGKITDSATIGATSANITISRNSDGTVSFRRQNSSSMLAISGTGVAWLTSGVGGDTPTDEQKWTLETHWISFSQADVDRNGIIDIFDQLEYVRYNMNLDSVIQTAVGFYLADITRDGEVTIFDQNEIVKRMNGTLIERSVMYETRASNEWRGWFKNRRTSGVTGLGMTGIKMRLSPCLQTNPIARIDYRVHTGAWQTWRNNGQEATGDIRAIQISLVNMSGWSVHYRVRVQGNWGNWVTNGGTAGNINQTQMIEAIEVYLSR
jgi:subtilisin family serine protease